MACASVGPPEFRLCHEPRRYRDRTIRTLPVRSHASLCSRYNPDLQLTLKSGTRFGPYEIVAPLGVGGMGEVYRATDTNLKRQVAIKVLPEVVAGDADRLIRFQREAEILASLNHPNIAHIHGLERTDSAIALAMELVEGPTLADRIARGPLPIEEVLPIAKQIAEGLEAAHEQGIVHRDLKPANIKLRPDGTAKILDFGLAKALEPVSPVRTNVSMSPTITSPAMTQAGIILGTAAYMSPEQASGKYVDKRSDIWAFGVVLMEMLTGRQLFDGETVSHVLAAVLTKDPDWSTLPPNTPRSVRALLRRCLERDPKRRLRDIGEARLALEDSSAGSTDDRAAAPLASAPPRRARIWPWLVGVVAVAIAGLAVGRYGFAPAREQSRPVRFEIRAGDVSSAVLSPDGTQLAIVSQGQLWVRDLGRLEPRPFEKTEGAVRPFWSPDSRTIAYGARGKLWKVPADGGAPAVICDLVSGLWDDDAGGAWLADGSIIYSDGNIAMWRVSAQGGDPVQLIKPDPQRELHFHTVSVLPDGRSVIYVVHRAGAGVGANTLAIWSNGQARILLELAGQTVDDPIYTSGHILFSRTPSNAGIWALPFSLKTLKADGEPFLVAQGMRSPSAAGDGTLVMLPPRRQRPVSIAWTDRAGNVLSRIDEPRLRQPTAAISPDGERVAVAELLEGKADIWQYDLDRKTRTRLTVNDAASDPVWLPDGRSLLVTARPPGAPPIIQRVAADGSGRVEEIVSGIRPAVSHDGATVFFTLSDKDGQRLWYRSLTTRDAKPMPFIEQSFYAAFAAPAPDGHLVAYEAESVPGQSEIFVRRFPPSEGMWQVSSGGGTSPRWSRDGHLYYAKGAEIFEVDITADPEVRVGTPVRLFKRTPAGGSAVPAPFNVSPDGKRFLIYEPVGDPAEQGIAVVQHWSSEFVH